MSSFGLFISSLSLDGKNPVLTLNHDALSEEVVHSSHSAVIPGKLKLFGTLKEFKELNAKEKLAQLKESVNLHALLSSYSFLSY